MSGFPVLAYPVLIAAFAGIAVGRFPRLAMNRPTIAFTAAVRIGFLDYLKVGAPVTVASVAVGTLWLGFTARLAQGL